MNTRKKILIVEDNLLLLKPLEEILQDTYIIAGVTDGKMALNMINDFTPDIILLDLMLPMPIDGFSLLRILKSSPSTNSIPIIIISGMTGDDKIIQALELGANDFLVKPYKSKELLLKIKNLTDLVQISEEKAIRNKILSVHEQKSINLNENTLNTFESIVENLIDIDVHKIPVIAKKLSLSVSTLERMIKNKYKMTPKQYITEVKLLKADILLRSKNTSIKMISFQLGFNSTAYFCHCFKKKFGISPRACANSLQKNL